MPEKKHLTPSRFLWSIGFLSCLLSLPLREYAMFRWQVIRRAKRKKDQQVAPVFVGGNGYESR